MNTSGTQLGVVSDKGSKNIMDSEQQVVYEFLLKNSMAGVVKKGAMIGKAEKFHVSTRTVHRIWKQGGGNLWKVFL